MRNSTRALAALGAVALLVVAAACSGHGSTSSNTRGAGRTIDVTMSDNAFAPTELRVSKGETVTFRFTNTGKVRHEAVLGDDAAQQSHHDEMATTGSTGSGHAGGTGDGHADDGHGDDGHGGGESHGSTPGSSRAITVEPDKTGELTHRFDESATVILGCHEPGHWEAGMKATVTIT